MAQHAALASETAGLRRCRDGNAYNFTEFSKWYGTAAYYYWREADMAVASSLLEAPDDNRDSMATAVVTLAKTSFQLDMQSFMDHLQKLQMCDKPYRPYNVQLKVMPSMSRRQGNYTIPKTDRHLRLSFFLTTQAGMETATEFEVCVEISIHKPTVLTGTVYPFDSCNLKPSEKDCGLSEEDVRSE